ncbi:tetratricopeptide repeat-containing sulfotransferase family protein [Congregibacter sp.]|uniref:tetratricopeptide repeat-containing sulfotransferase family protein n=1 Tax=Congregibacter sp. TaxID=2744308 RepID=UPI003F6B9B3B
MAQQNADQANWLKATLRDGYDRLQRGDQAGAANCCRQVLQRKPDLVEGHFLVGMIAMNAEDPKTAIQGFGSVTKLQPDHSGAWAQLARLFMRRGQINRAEDALHKAVAHSDDNAVVHDTIATVYTQLGDALSAAQWQEKALEAQPQNIGFLINRANNQMFLGDFKGARQRLEEVLLKNPKNANAHWLLSGLEKARDRQHIEELASLLSTEKLGDRDRAYLAYGLGKELEDMEDWPAAFRAFAEGAAARRRGIKFDENSEKAAYQALADTYTEDWLGNKQTGCDAQAPIFIVGQPRTGTTLIERIITSHSEVHSAGELRQFEGAFRRLLRERSDDGLTGVIRATGDLNPEEIGRAYMTLSKPMQGEGSRFVDKLPMNFRFLPLILAALPNAKVVHVRRGPMDACFASFKQLFADAYPHSYDQEEMARHHGRYYALMATWRERFGSRFIEVDYEKIAGDPQPHARELIADLDLQWEDQCLDFYQQSGAVTTASAVQVREAAHTRSVGRWLRYESELAPMQKALTDLNIPLEH